MSIANHADQFKQSFREEAREIVVNLEGALLALNENTGDAELVGAIFRGLHTIKGSGAMFGFEELAAFTHHLETAFDEVRNRRLAVNPELIDLTLAALDQIRSMIEEGEGTKSADPVHRAEILAKVQRLTGISGKQRENSKAAQGETRATGESPLTEWVIRFAPGPELLLNGANPLLLLSELRGLGGLSVKASMAAVPPLGELDPERCYIAWEMVLATSAAREAIRDVFIFVEDLCELTVEPAAKPAGPSPQETPTKMLEESRAEYGGRRAYDRPDTSTSIRVPSAKLDKFVDLVGELVTVQARLSEVAAESQDCEVAAVSEEIERLTSALRENSMNIRMLPIRSTFERFRRLVHDLARDLGKDVMLTIEGAETELDKAVIDQLNDPLMHLIRNCMDHGIETPGFRRGHGKQSTATIKLAARHSGATVLIEVSDDGAGIDAEAVRMRAIEKGLVSSEAQLTDAEIYALIFQPGFSTAKQISDISGRGVGMDVVHQSVESLRGTIDIESVRGRGTSVTLRLPLTLAIIDGLLVRVEDAHFVLPLANTLECVELTRADLEWANGKRVANVRGELVPYIGLRERFNLGGERPEIEQIMLVEAAGARYGLVVDKVLGDCQTVIKNLGRFYRHVQVVSGATILGNGKVALILDPERLVQEAVRTVAHGPRGRPSRAGAAGHIPGVGSTASASLFKN